MIVDIYTDSSDKAGSLTLPDGKVTTKFLRDNWATIITGLLPILPLDMVKEHLNTQTGLTVDDADTIKWLQNPFYWKRGHKGKLEDNGEYWGIPNADPKCVHRMFWTDEFLDGMDLNFFSAPKDAALLSIHLHSD